MQVGDRVRLTSTWAYREPVAVGQEGRIVMHFPFERSPDLFCVLIDDAPELPLNFEASELEVIG